MNKRGYRTSSRPNVALSESVNANGGACRGLGAVRSRTGIAIGSFLFFVAGIYLVSRLTSDRPLTIGSIKLLRDSGGSRARTGPLPTVAQRAYQPPPPLKTTVRPIEGSASSLATFFAALRRTERRSPGAITRILHIGDSQIARDILSGAVRRRLAKRFGDAGRGMVLFAGPRFYVQQDVAISRTGYWGRTGILNPQPFSDRRHGLIGAHQWAAGRASATFVASPKVTVGSRVGRFEVGYLQTPKGGRFVVEVDGKPQEVVNTRTATANATVRHRVWSVNVPDGPHTFTLRHLGLGFSRFTGVVLERRKPGVVYDAAGLVGTQMHYLMRIDAEHWKRQLQWRRPQLIVFGFGTNEIWGKIRMSYYRSHWSRLLRRVRAALPQSSCLMLGPVDRIYYGGKSHPRIAPVTRTMREVALAQGCAFWDTAAAMGGKGAALRWRRAGLFWGDLTHLNVRGSHKLADLLTTALLERYQRFKDLQAYRRRTSPSP